METKVKINTNQSKLLMKNSVLTSLELKQIVVKLEEEEYTSGSKI